MGDALVLVSVPANAAVCSPAGPALELTAFNEQLPGFRQGDGSVSYQPVVILTNNGPGPVTVLQATATPSDVEMLISSLDVDVVTSSWGPITALPNGAPSLTLAAPAPQDVIAAGSSKEYQFLLSLLGAVPGQHTVVLSMAGDCTSDVLSLTFQVQEPDE